MYHHKKSVISINNWKRADNYKERIKTAFTGKKKNTIQEVNDSCI